MKIFKSVGLLISSSIIVSGCTILLPNSSEAIVIKSNATNKGNTLINLTKPEFSSNQITDLKPRSSSITDLNVGGYFIASNLSRVRNGVRGAESLYENYQQGTLFQNLLQGGVIVGVGFGVFWFFGSLLEKRR
ncbi:hypothetical protein ACQFX9_18240 [Aliinostoc sp. HNIBRCY26]|uniref:hypothetical protein n=1 Tax=Aliinostoc sp. HNIBRCY26 TaxID=3418997 RepID=UPI003CFCB039